MSVSTACSEAWIERHAEAWMDRLDRHYLNSSMTEAEYKAEVAEIEAWTKRARAGEEG